METGNVKLTVRVPTELKARVRRIARQREQTVQVIVKRALHAYLARFASGKDAA